MSLGLLSLLLLLWPRTFARSETIIYDSNSLLSLLERGVWCVWQPLCGYLCWSLGINAWPQHLPVWATEWRPFRVCPRDTNRGACMPSLCVALWHLSTFLSPRTRSTVISVGADVVRKMAGCWIYFNWNWDMGKSLCWAWSLTQSPANVHLRCWLIFQRLAALDVDD